MKDIHLIPTPNFKDIEKYIACIPFSFYIKKDENDTYQFYMRQNSDCQFMYDDPNITEFINNAIQQNFVIS